MRVRWLAGWLCFLVLAPTVASAEVPCVPSEDLVCLPKPDFQRFLTIASERQCLERTKPTFVIDQIVVLTDTEGRVFYTGADKNHPYKLQMKWCHYDIEGQGKIDLVAGMAVPPRAGFRFRPKAYLSYLPFKLSKGKFNEGIDAGILIDWLYFDWVNLNVAAGFRSVGMGAGFDLTRNFGAYVGYGVGWTAPLHNINVGVSFAF